MLFKLNQLLLEEALGNSYRFQTCIDAVKTTQISLSKLILLSRWICKVKSYVIFRFSVFLFGNASWNYMKLRKLSLFGVGLIRIFIANRIILCLTDLNNIIVSLRLFQFALWLAPILFVFLFSADSNRTSAVKLKFTFHLIMYTTLYEFLKIQFIKMERSCC